MTALKKVVFQLEQDEDGYPPVTIESVWAREEADGRFVLDNIPFFATQATLGDLVDVAFEGGEARYVATVRHSGNSLIRVLCARGSDPADVRAGLAALGCSTEWLAAYSIVAVNVPPEVSLSEAQKFLNRGAESGKWEYEEPLLMQ
jgi:hypothetical protein